MKTETGFNSINNTRRHHENERYKNIISKRFGRVVVIDYAESTKVRRVLVRCDCGNEYPITYKYLLKRHETQCSRCSQIIINRGIKGYKEFLNDENKWVSKMPPDYQFRKLREYR